MRLLIVFITILFDLIAFGMIIPLHPYLAREFGGSPLLVGLLMSTYSLFQFIFSPFWGQISDRVGRRPILLLTLFGSALSHIMFAFSPSLLFLFLARSLAGFFGANLSTAMAAVADITPLEKRSQSMGLVGAAFGLGFVLGPFFGAYLTDIGTSISQAAPFGHQFPALMAGIIGLCNFVFAFFAFKETLQKTEGTPKKRLSRLAQLKAVKENHSPLIMKLILLFFLSTIALAIIEAPLFMWMQDKYSWTLKQASLGFAYIGILMAFTQGYLVRKFLPKYGEKNILQLSLVLMLLGFLGLAASVSILTLALALTLFGIGHGLFQPSVTGSLSGLTRKEDQGLIMGLNQSFSALARILGPALGGFVYGSIHPRIPFSLSFTFILLGLFLYFKYKNQIPSFATKLPTAKQLKQKTPKGTAT